MIINVFDNFLPSEECNKIIETYANHQHKVKKWGNTFPLPLVSVGSLAEKLSTKSSVINNSTLDWMEIVKWPVDSYQNLHVDKAKKDTILAAIIYLNDDYEGGQTYFADNTVIQPKQGRVLFFDGKYYRHGVTLIKNSNRFTIAAWFKNKPILKKDKQG